MNENEFKKRIIENALRETCDGMACSYKGDNFDYIRLIDLRAILDEARKEFPCDNRDAGCDFICENCELPINWFEKWFGYQK